MVSRSRFLFIVCAMFLATGCRDPNAPLVVPASYVARTVEGTPVPATLVHGSASEVALLADTIHLHPMGVAKRISIHRYTTIGAPVAVDTSRYQESYTVRGDSLRFSRYCPPEANCVGAPEGILSADRRHLLLRLWPAGPVARYDRIAP